MSNPKPWNGTCPKCGGTEAYQGFSFWECNNPFCSNYTPTQDQLVRQAKKEIEEQEEKKNKEQNDFYYMGYHSTCNKDASSSQNACNDEQDDNINYNDDDIDTLPYGITTNTKDQNGYYTNKKTQKNDKLYNDLKDLFGLFLC